MGRLDLRTLGELGLIRTLRRRAGEPGRRWLRGIGDDAAILRPRPGHDLVVTTDALVENVHFRFRTSDARSLGHKALAVNLSDVGAMGARPLGFVLSLAIPRATPEPRLDGFLSGLLTEARSAECPLVGGDTVEAPSWVVTVTAFGEVARGAALQRGGARPGDRLAVSGELGGAALGLAVLERGAGSAPGVARFVRRQLRPRPPVHLGRRLTGVARAAIDLSDGLAIDLDHLLRESGLGADVGLDRLPLSRRFGTVAAQMGLDPLELALHGGEDYELLVALPRDAPSAERLGRRLGVRLTEIGTVRRGRGARYWLGGRRIPVARAGFSHFRGPHRVKGSKFQAEK
ncbi:MAG: thiamine-phosphate kinase [Myxococcota bacterium]